MAASCVCTLGGGELNKKPVDSASTSVWGKAAPSVLTLQPDNSVPFRMFLVPFKLLPQCCGSERVSSRSPCTGPLREMGLQPSCFTQPQSLMVFTARVMGASVNPGTLGWGAWCGTGTLSLLQGTSTAKMFFLISNSHTWL